MSVATILAMEALNRQGFDDSVPRWAGIRPRICKVAGCELAHRARGFCMRHYKRWRRNMVR